MTIETTPPLGGMDVVIRQGSRPGWIFLSPSDTAPNSVLNTRRWGLELLGIYTEDVTKFRVPRIGELTATSLEVERAQGVCLQGTSTEGNDMIFYALPTDDKLQALKIYLSAVHEVNRNSQLIHDHNPDGIFIDYSPEGQVVVWLVDPGDIDKNLHKGVSNYDHSEVRDSHGTTGIHKLLRSFFDRGREESCTPVSLLQMMKEVEAGKNVGVSELLSLVSATPYSEVERAENYRRTVLNFLQM